MSNVRLGWANPLSNVLSGEDAANLRLLFTSLSHWLQFPLIGVSATNVSIANLGAVIPWSGELYDEYQLHAANATTWRVPAAFRTYLAVGVAGLYLPGTLAAAATVAALWQVNGVDSAFTDFTKSLNPFQTQVNPVFMKMVTAGQTIGIRLFHDHGAAQDVNGEAWMMFLPMGAGQG